MGLPLAITSFLELFSSVDAVLQGGSPAHTTPPSSFSYKAKTTLSMRERSVIALVACRWWLQEPRILNIPAFTTVIPFFGWKS
ncbi:hypothetical protein Pcinc_037665 [Petrolisthes cinctipes]|uniref:Uncharacterized protein n=1 Tax=Petrolisthes cinctipes TaxID=88211 RepID=A0AAE1BSE9_PETCI|nr:hypothetical protein Pcinc_037665 [Petrolisthes cinctipes]